MQLRLCICRRFPSFLRATTILSFAVDAATDHVPDKVIGEAILVAERAVADVVERIPRDILYSLRFVGTKLIGVSPTLPIYARVVWRLVPWPLPSSLCVPSTLHWQRRHALPRDTVRLDP